MLPSQFFSQQPPTPLQKIDLPVFNEHGLHVYCKRDDLIHAELSGNKWRKLKYNLLAAEQQGATTLLTFSGAYSNHLHAFASACKMFDFNGIAIIRGEESTTPSATLVHARNAGLHLHFINRDLYRQRSSPIFLQQLRQKFGKFLLIPEGGSNALALPGVSEVISEIKTQLATPFNTIMTACGTGGTLAGLCLGLGTQQSALGIAVLKGDKFLHQDINSLLLATNSHIPNYQLLFNYHHGGYARFTPELIQFMHDFTKHTDIVLDPVYTGKMLYALVQEVRLHRFAPGHILVALHTGGLQGLAGFKQRFPKLAQLYESF